MRESKISASISVERNELMATLNRSTTISLLAGAVIVSTTSLVWIRRRQKHKSIHKKQDVTSRNLPPTESAENIPRPTLEDRMKESDNTLAVKPIGRVRSVYRLCVGTPRQGLLAPHARGCVELDCEADSVEGLHDFSHIWVIFLFHLNTKSKNAGQKPTKIAPPALGGRKVGVFCTRSPHRPNPIGISLVKLDRIETITKPQPNKRPKQIVCLHISGLDLVDGTPVVDIKPFVGTYDDAPMAHVPSWVSGGLRTKRQVFVDTDAESNLRLILSSDPNALAFYGGRNEDVEETVSNVLASIEEVLAMDVRSPWQTKKVRQGKSQAEKAKRLQKTAFQESKATVSECTQQLDNLLIHFTVKEAEDVEQDTSEGSGAEDLVMVTSIELFKPGK